MDKVLNFRQGADENQAILKVPGFALHSARRVTHKLSVYPPHEAFRKEVLETAEPRALLREALTRKTLPDRYWTNEVVQRTADEVHVAAVYLDGTPYSKKDGVLAIVVANLLTRRRHLVAVVRKSIMCRCGCRGWCTLWPIFNFVAWSFQAMATNTFPNAPCAMLEWPADHWRATVGGLRLGFHAMCLQIMLDWSEAANTMGFWPWNTVNFPCIWCQCERSTLHYLDGRNMSFRLNTMADYEAAAASVEVIVRITTWLLFLSVRSALGLDGRPRSGKGKFIRRDLPALGLRTGDRLEPSEAVPDYAILDTLKALPAEGLTLTFWRGSQLVPIRHRNPLFSRFLGISPSSMLGDVLHALYLGVFQVFAGHLFQACVQSNVWGAPGHYAGEARLEFSLSALMQAITAWYRSRALTLPFGDVTEVQDLTTNDKQRGKLCST